MTKVFVHGVPETADLWRPLVASLVAQGVNDVVLLSPPGFGAPVPQGWGGQPGDYVRWLATELVTIDGPIDLVGHDWGAGHVCGLLATQPELVRSWAVDIVGIIHPDYVWHDTAQTWRTPDEGEAALEAMMSFGPAAIAEVYVSMGMAPEVAGDVAAGLDQDMIRSILGLYRAAPESFLAELGRTLVAAELPPGLVIDATADSYVASSLGQQMVEPLGADHLVLDGQDHWWMNSDPDGAAAGLINFWNQL